MFWPKIVFFFAIFSKMIIFSKIWYQKWILWLISIPEMYTFINITVIFWKLQHLICFKKFCVHTLLKRKKWIRGSWMGLSAWTIVYARGHKKRSCTQSHSWTPFIHQFMMDHPSYAIILQIHTFNLPKIHEKPPFILPLSTFKSYRKIGDLLGMYHSRQGCALCVYIRLGA